MVKYAETKAVEEDLHANLSRKGQGAGDYSLTCDWETLTQT